MMQKLGSLVWIHNGTLHNDNVTKGNVLQKGTCYKTVRVTKRYVLQNGTITKRYVLQNSTLQNSTLSQNGTFLKLYYACINPWISWAFVLT
jgi:hypothetical protein